MHTHARTLREAAVKGDRMSWWGKNTKGESVLCRVTHAGRIPELHRLFRDPRILRLAALSDQKFASNLFAPFSKNGAPTGRDPSPLTGSLCQW